VVVVAVLVRVLMQRKMVDQVAVAVTPTQQQVQASQARATTVKTM
jgi:hypothetical protein